jgi:hypothetical protein
MLSHGHSVGGVLTPEYSVWRGMKARCLNPKNKYFAKYSPRGMWPPWQTDFLAFFEHIGPRPSPWHTVERIDNSRGYFPGNVRWATAAEQAINRRDNIWLEHDGKRLTVAQWARVLGLQVSTIHKRLDRGWPPERALTEPVRRTKP